MAERHTRSREDLIAEVQAIAARLGRRSLSKAEFKRETGVSERLINKHFDSWNVLVQTAGLEPNTKSFRIEDDELLRAMRDAYVLAGGIVPISRFAKACRYSEAVFTRRWSDFRTAQVRFRDWVEVNDPTFPYIDQLPSSHAPRQPKPPPSTYAADAALAWPSQRGDHLYGEFINFRSLQHAPVNEQGVVLLFGMVAHDLGFVIERVQTGYPDCEAKRRVKGGRGYERTRVEFEFRSRNFDHQPDGCDLVICWEHDWPDCPVEVLELKSAIKSLSDTAR